MLIVISPVTSGTARQAPGTNCKSCSSLLDSGFWPHAWRFTPPPRPETAMSPKGSTKTLACLQTSAGKPEIISGQGKLVTPAKLLFPECRGVVICLSISAKSIGLEKSNTYPASRIWCPVSSLSLFLSPTLSISPIGVAP